LLDPHLELNTTCNCIKSKLIEKYINGNYLRGEYFMQSDFITNEASVACEVEKGKTAWHRPSVARIDIKRTLSGTGTKSDGASPTT
jgi:hypothetical protein